LNLGGAEVLLLFGGVLLPMALALWVAVDAARYPNAAFEAARTSKTLWVILPVAGIFFCPLGVVAAALWFGVFRRRVVGAAT
jgi:hypothetical protein